jgi:hypothetical protein
MMDADNPTAPDAAGPAPSGEVPSSPERRKAGRRIADTEDYPGEPKRFRTRRAADRAANEQVLMTPEKALHVLRLMVGSAEMYGKARDAGRHTPAHLIPDPVQGGKILAKVIPPLAALRDELVALRASLASRPAPGEPTGSLKGLPVTLLTLTLIVVGDDKDVTFGLRRGAAGAVDLHSWKWHAIRYRDGKMAGRSWTVQDVSDTEIIVQKKPTRRSLEHGQ